MNKDNEVTTEREYKKDLEKGKNSNDEKYSKYSVIWGVLSIIIFGLFGFVAICYGSKVVKNEKASKDNRTRGWAGIILGIIGLVLTPIEIGIFLAL